MNTLDITQLQKAVGVKADGILGRNTLTAVFQKLGANPACALRDIFNQDAVTLLSFLCSTCS